MIGLVAGKQPAEVHLHLTGGGAAKFQAHVKQSFRDCGIESVINDEISLVHSRSST
jgi:hypothetical protein